MSSSLSSPSGRFIKVEVGAGGLSLEFPFNGSKPTIRGKELFRVIATAIRSKGIHFKGKIRGIQVGDVVYDEDAVVDVADITGNRKKVTALFSNISGDGFKPEHRRHRHRVSFDDGRSSHTSGHSSSHGSKRSSHASDRSSFSSGRSSRGHTSGSSGSRFDVLQDFVEEVAGTVKVLSSDVKTLRADGARSKPQSRDRKGRGGDAASSGSATPDSSANVGSSKPRNRKHKGGPGKRKGGAGSKRSSGGAAATTGEAASAPGTPGKPATESAAAAEGGAASAPGTPGKATKGAKAPGKPAAASAPSAARARLLLGNIPYSLTSKDLLTRLESHGALSAEVATGISGRSAGYGFATFSGKRAAVSAREALDGSVILGRKINVCVVRESGSAPGGSGDARPAPQSASGEPSSPFASVLEAYKQLTAEKGGLLLHRQCYLAANGLQIIPVTGYMNSCPAASVLTAVSGKHLPVPVVESFFQQVFTPWMTLLSKLKPPQVEALVAPRLSSGDADETQAVITAHECINRCSEYRRNRSAPGNCVDIAMAAFLVNYDGIFIKALQTGNDEGGHSPDLRSLAASTTFIPRIAFATLLQQRPPRPPALLSTTRFSLNSRLGRPRPSGPVSNLSPPRRTV